jgi:hypothetical protein
MASLHRSTVLLDISKPTDSPIGTRFIVPSLLPEIDGRKCWPQGLRFNYKYYLERSNNRSVLIGAKRSNYIRWLKNPSGKAIGGNIEER